ncbi:MAG: hypothetical protein IJK44_05070 [Bacteroidales bacterium]|nr:hypothetical protein [Bacteroidales bacterium]
MKSFRHIAFVLAAAALAAGCTKTEVSAPEREITFSVGSRVAKTKAAVEITEFESFKSKGYLHAEGVNDVQDFFGASGETITKTGSEWLPSHPYYWPKSESSYINFISWYDKNGAPNTVTENTIEWSNRTIAQDDNILVANKAWFQKANVQNYFTSGVPTLFKHLLAQVAIQAKTTIDSETAGNVTTTWTVEVSDVTINNVRTSGSISLSNTTAPEDEQTLKITEWTGSWETNATTANLAGPATATTLNATSYTEILPWHAVLPQDVEDIYISLSYEVTTESENSATHSTHSVTETVEVPNLALNSFTGYAGNWDSNKRITYSIQINPKTNIISVLPTVVAWETDNKEIIVE